MITTYKPVTNQMCHARSDNVWLFFTFTRSYNFQKLSTCSVYTLGGIYKRNTLRVLFP